METLPSEDIDLVALAGYLSTSPLLSLGLARGYPNREESSRVESERGGSFSLS